MVLLFQQQYSNRAVIIKIKTRNGIHKKARRSVLGHPCRDHRGDLPVLQRRRVLPDLHPSRHSADIRVRPHHPQDPQVPVGQRALSLDLHLLRHNLRHPLCHLHLLQRISTFRLQRRHHIQIARSASNCFLRVHPMGYLRALQEQLQPRSGQGQVLLPGHFRSSDGAVLPLQPEQDHRGRLRLGVHSVLGDSGHPQPILPLHQESQGSEIETYTSHFVASQAISRILSIIFWVFTYSELNELNRERSTSILPEYVGYWFMFCQVIHLFIMADFMYYWVKAIRRGEGITLPTYV